MKTLPTPDYLIAFHDEGYRLLRQWVQEWQPSKVVVLTDHNTRQLCLPLFLERADLGVTVETLSFPAGEAHKILDTCIALWRELSALKTDRNALLINLGGGVVGDLGGFVAATYMRGINFVQVPTTLLSMVDASVGGKTGVDLDGLKNQVGVFRSPQQVLVDTDFLQTLPQRELHAGLAEMWKHALIAAPDYWEQLADLSPNNSQQLVVAIHTSIGIKNEVVTSDPQERGRRKILNFGHTLGHAIESYFLNKKSVLHGEAVAVGLLLAGYISHHKLGFPVEDLQKLAALYKAHFQKISFSESEQTRICSLLQHDKKNSRGHTRFVLLREVGAPQIDCTVTTGEIEAAFAFYQNL